MLVHFEISECDATTQQREHVREFRGCVGFRAREVAQRVEVDIVDGEHDEVEYHAREANDEKPQCEAGESGHDALSTTTKECHHKEIARLSRYVVCNRLAAVYTTRNPGVFAVLLKGMNDRLQPLHHTSAPKRPRLSKQGQTRQDFHSLS